MSDFDKNNRKKKVFVSPRGDKEFTPRKPVILTKNDRESKETDRNKAAKDKPIQVEKEKPPVIMIKTRETSAAKESDVRAQSPKKSTAKEGESENSVAPVIKIAQNENKEKKANENKFQIPVSSMTRPVKLIDDYLEFSSSSAEFLQDANSNFLVVGIIGGQSVGKSTVMNILAHCSDLSSLREEILKSHEFVEIDDSPDLVNNGSFAHDGNAKIIVNSNMSEESKTKPLIFKCQDMAQIETGQACTIGVDMFVTNSRVILLDTGPIYGPGANRMMNSGTYNIFPRGGLEISAFLLAVCHVIILVQDWFVDINMLRFIQSAEMVKPSIPAASTMNHLSTPNQENDINLPKEHYPHLLFIQNKCSMDDFHPSSVKLMQELYSKAFNKSKLNIYSGLYLYDPVSDNSINQIDELYHNLNAEQCGKPLNLFLLPLLDDSEKNVYNGHPTIEELGHRLRTLIFGASRNQLTNVQLNERTWLQYCNKTWDNVKKSTFFIEYNRLLP